MNIKDNHIFMDTLARNRANSPSTTNQAPLDQLSDGSNRYTTKLTDKQRDLKAMAEDAKDELNYHREDTTIEVWDE